MIGFVSHVGFNRKAFNAIDYEQVTLDGTNKGLAASKVASAEYAFLRVSGGPVRALWFPGGSLVLANNFGSLMFDAENTVLNKAEMQQFLATLDAAAASAILHVHYYAL